MVSAATAALLVPHLPAGQSRETTLLFCHMCFGLTLVASLIIVTLIWNRLLRHGLGAAGAVPTLWIVLGPLGRSITAAHNLGVVALGALPSPYGQAFEAFALSFGVPLWGFAMRWLVLAGAQTLLTARRGLV